MEEQQGGVPQQIGRFERHPDFFISHKGYRQATDPLKPNPPEWGKKPFFFGLLGGSMDYGNDPRDTFMTHQGFKMASEGKSFESREVPCENVGL
jgi:hypothetical protein